MLPTDVLGVIPAAGEGLRLGLPYPKELYPIIRDGRYKPVAQHVLENMVAIGVEHVVFVINETKHQLLGYFGDGQRFGCHVTYAFQENTPQERSGSAGLAEALDSAHHLMGDRRVLFGMADTVIRPVDAMRPLLDTPAEVHLGLFTTEHPERVGIVESDAAGRAVRIADKQPAQGLFEMWGCISWGARFSAYLHEQVASDRKPDFAAILNGAIQSKFDVRATPLTGASYADVGTYEEIERLERDQGG